MKKKQSDTSLAAYHSLDENYVAKLKRLILAALHKLGRASSEEVADYIGEPYDCTWKRCSDLKNEGKIYATHYRVITKRKRFAAQWALMDGIVEAPKPEKAMKGKSVGHYAKNIQQLTQQSLF